MAERLLALGTLVASVVYLVSALPLPRGTPARPGAGFFPVAVGAFGIAVTLAWTVSAFRHASATAREAALPDGRGRVIATGLLLVGFCLGLPWVGYPLAAFAFVGGLLRSLGAGWAAAIALALVCALGSHLVFGTLLGVPLPRGLLFG